MKSILSKIDISDVFIMLGLLMIWVGLFLWFGSGQATAVDGGLMLVLGVCWNIRRGAAAPDPTDPSHGAS